MKLKKETQVLNTQIIEEDSEIYLGVDSIELERPRYHFDLLIENFEMEYIRKLFGQAKNHFTYFTSKDVQEENGNKILLDLLKNLNSSY